MPPYDPKRQAELLQAYRNQAAQAQLLLQLLAMLAAPVQRSSIPSAFNRLNEAAGGGQTVSVSAVEFMLRALDGAGLLKTTKQQIQCHPAVVEPVARQAMTSEQFSALCQVVERYIKELNPYNYFYYRSGEEVLRDLRFALFRGDLTKAREVLRAGLERFHQEFAGEHPYRLLVERPFDEEWLLALAPEVRAHLLETLVQDTLMRLRQPGPLDAMAAHLCLDGGRECDPYLRLLLAHVALLRGEWPEATRLLPPDSPADAGQLVAGWIATFGSEPAKALPLFDAYIGKRRTGSKRKVDLPMDFGPIYLVALLRNGAVDKAEAYVRANCSGRATKDDVCALLSHLLAAARQAHSERDTIETALAPPPFVVNVLTLLFFETLYWEDERRLRRHVDALSRHHRTLSESGYHWLAAEVAELLARLLGAEGKAFASYAVSVRRKAGVDWSIVDLVARVEPWQRALNALSRLAEGGGDAVVTASEERLVWLVAQSEEGYWRLQPKVQKRTAKGNWTAGRVVSLRRLYTEADELSFLASADRQVLPSIRREQYGYYGADDYDIDVPAALAALVGHPLVFWDGPSPTRVEVVRGAPELLVKRHDGRLQIRLVPDPGELAEGDYVVVREGLSRLKVVGFDTRQREVALILAGGLDVPESASEQVLGSLGAIAGLVTVQSDIGAGGEVHETVVGDPTPHLQLLPFQAGLKALLLVRPFADRGPYYRPGAGGRTVVADLEGKRIQADRDLDHEQTRAAEATAPCPVLGAVECEEDTWLLPEPEQALELLEQVHGLGERVRIEWPEGQRFRLAGQADTRQLRVSVHSARDWLNATGSVTLPDGRVLDMLRLLELIGQTPGRFLQIGEGEYIALTREFRRRLGDLAALSERSGKGVKLSALAGLALEELAAEAGEFVGDAGWDDFRRRYQEAMASRPRVPSTLQTELRDYQTDGFRWLSRLARWGVGACLADDMGLGKTVQALALLLQRAPQGAALVVAPTSVTGNWRAEAARFAPTLNLILYATADRDQVLADLKPFDLVVCSYGLLQQDADKLAQVRWNTVVLDEAQAIKNAATKRSQAAMGLQGEFKVITTGTPVENHLGELWNLFRFINPGLLGSLERFNQRFATPIERDHDAAAQSRLRRLIQPFILRRTKTQVLDELPPRTEILQQVELNVDERAFYEALRGRALARLEAPPQEGPGASGQRQLQILAEITRLRRSCCNTRLVPEGPALPSAKLEAFGEILEDLLENRHKALVFSQFVDHLSLIREFLDQRQVSYQYLDGATPAAERERRVRAFQGGEGDLFLISLRAGGVGLNLTAADYVIHMDPWWNPAVEDQAADRAHRIGQQRPVTIYRLVAKDTIEEKIVALHHQKRDLADSLLEGAEMGAKVSPEELLRLLKEE